MVKLFGKFEIGSPGNKDEKKKQKGEEEKKKPQSHQTDEMVQIEEKKNDTKTQNPNNSINNFDVTYPHQEQSKKTLIPRKGDIFQEMKNGFFSPDVIKNYSYDEDILDESNIYKRTGKKRTEVEKKYIEQKKKLHAELNHIRKEFKKQAGNINEYSRKEIEILLERYKKGVSREELDFLKNKINNFNGQLIILEDEKTGEEYYDDDVLYKYMLKYVLVQGEKLPTEQEAELIRDFIENFLLLYTDYVKKIHKEELKISHIQKEHREKVGLSISWEEAIKEIMIQNDFLTDKLTQIFKISGKKKINFTIKHNGINEPFGISEEGLNKLLSGKKVKLERENPESWEAKEENISIEEKSEINTEEIADIISETVSITPEEKNQLLDFLRNYTKWYPETDTSYDEIKNTVKKLRNVIKLSFRNDIEALVDMKSKEIGKRYKTISRKIDDADISRKSRETLTGIVVDLKENGLGEEEENFMLNQIKLHTFLQKKSLEIEGNYLYKHTDIYNDISFLRQETIGRDDLQYIDDKIKEIKTNINSIISQGHFQNIIEDRDPKKENFKRILLSIYINKKTQVGEEVYIEDLDEETLRNIVEDNNALKTKKNELIELGGNQTIINIGGIELYYQYESTSEKLRKAEIYNGSNFNLIEFLNIEGLPESVLQISEPLITELIAEKEVNSLLQKNVRSYSSEKDIKRLQIQFSRIKSTGKLNYTYAGPIDGKYESIKPYIINFQHEHDIVLRDKNSGKGSFGPGTRRKFNAIYKEQLKQNKNIHFTEKENTKEIQQIKERLKLLNIYFLYSWSEGNKGTKSSYLSGELKEGLYGYEVYNHNERYEASLKATEDIYESFKEMDDDEYKWVEDELDDKPSAKEWIESWTGKRKRKNILYNMRSKIKSTHILKQLGESDSRTPINLTTERQMITFNAHLNSYKRKDLYDFLIHGKTSALKRLHWQHFGKRSPKKNRIFESQRTFEGGKFYEKIMANVLNNIHENGKDNGVPTTEHYNFSKRDIADMLGNYVTNKAKIGGAKNSCGLAVYRLLRKADVWVENIIPNGNRHGYRYEQFLDKGIKKETFIKVPISHPKEAMAGGIVVYGKGSLGTKARKKYGHVEVVGNDGSYYSYYKGKNPGGSSYRYATSKYERDVISGKIDNPYLFKELTGFTGYVYYPLEKKGKRRK